MRPIDRGALLARHRPRLSAIDPQAPLSVGNGEFCFTADVTGLQTFPTEYGTEAGPGENPGTLLGTMAQWAWHSMPGAEVPLTESMRLYESPHGTVPYVDLDGSAGIHDQRGQTPGQERLRNNPHRLDLARIGLWAEDGAPRPEELHDVDQVLDLETGVVASSFTLAARRMRVRTAAHPERDAVAILIEVDDDETVGIRFAFPYGSEDWGNAADWDRPTAHESDAAPVVDGWRIDRRLDAVGYTVRITSATGDLIRIAPHEYVLQARGGLQVTAEFTRATIVAPALSADTVIGASERHWSAFWASGGLVDFSASDDPRSAELERRVVLSQYLTAIQCAGSLPPAETGLTLNSWRGKFHLEMHWWHAAHFAQWGRPALLERSLGWYESILERARATARAQNLPGVRWPKQVGPDGVEAPSAIGPFLVWQQPHPIHLAELIYRARRDRATLERWSRVVFETAEFMAGFAAESSDGYDLGPPIVPAQESYAATRATARNPTFELAYWSWALRVALVWCERLGVDAPARWRAVADGMTPPARHDGTYAALGTSARLIREDHPSMLAALGLVPRTPLIDPATMSRTLDDVLREWDWGSAWGWDFPATAMTATRLGRPDAAVDVLLMACDKNRYLVNGHNRQNARLPVYLPGNGGLLAAVGLMAAGWDDGPPSPGFGRGWRVRHEGIDPSPS